MSIRSSPTIETMGSHVDPEALADDAGGRRRSFRIESQGRVMVSHAPQAPRPRRKSLRPDATPMPMSVPPPGVREDDDESEKGFGVPLDPYRIMRVLLMRPRPLLLAALAGIALALLASTLLPQKYLATSTLKYTDMTDQGQGIEARARALSAAVDASHDINVLRDIGRRIGGESSGSVAARMETIPDVDLAVLRVRSWGASPAAAAHLANEAGAAIIARLADGERRAARAEATAIESRLENQSQELEQAQSAYDVFRREHGIADLATERTQQIDSAANLRSQHDLAVADIDSLVARVTQLRRDLATAPRMVASSASSTSLDQQQLARLEGQLITARGTYSDEHPAVRSLAMQVDSLRRRIASGQSSSSTQVTMGASSQYQMLQSSLAAAEAELAAARQRSTSIDELAHSAASRVTAFSAIEGEATQLLSAVRTQETLVEELHNRRARLESKLHNPDARFAAIAPATLPTGPEPATKKKIAIFALPFIVFFGVAFALIARDIGRGRMRTPSEIAYWSKLPVIAASDWPRNLRGLDDIVADMDDWSGHANGLTLLVPASEREAHAAATLADRLDDGWALAEPPTEPKSHVGPQPTPPRAGRAAQRPISTIVVTPPPADSRPSSTALVRTAREPVSMQLYDPNQRLVTAWTGGLRGPKLRREARLASRVAVVVSSGFVTIPELVKLRTRLGRDHGVGIMVVDLQPEYLSLPDRVGPVDAFWHAGQIDE